MLGFDALGAQALGGDEVGGNVSITVPSADLTLSSSVPIVAVPINIEIPSAAFVLSTSATTVAVGREIVIPSANVALSSAAPTLAQTTSANIAVPSGNLRLTTAPPSVRKVVNWTTPPGANPDLLCPRRITVELVADTESGGRSLTGRRQYVQPDAGYWRIVLGEIRIRSNADVLAWREIEAAAEGRANPLLVQIYDRKRAPLPIGGAPIVAVADAAALANAATMTILVTSGSALIPGMHFSTGERLYRIRQVVSQVGNVYTVKVRPPIREDIPDNAPLEFEHPVCRCRLETDDAMNVTLDLMKFATPTVAFIEDHS